MRYVTLKAEEIEALELNSKNSNNTIRLDLIVDYHFKGRRCICLYRTWEKVNEYPVIKGFVPGELSCMCWLDIDGKLTVSDKGGIYYLPLILIGPSHTRTGDMNILPV